MLVEGKCAFVEDDLPSMHVRGRPGYEREVPILEGVAL